MTGDRYRDREFRLRFRRAVTLLLMTLVAPGTAQLVAGNRRIGRYALRVVLGVVVVAALLGLLALIAPTALVRLLTASGVLRAFQIGLAGLAVGWLALFVDAWRLGRPLDLRHKQRLTTNLLAVGLSVVTVGALLTSSHYASVARESIQGIFGDAEPSDPYAGRYNVLLLGGDAGPDRIGLRPDSVTLVSIDKDDGRAAMFSFPRNLYSVPFPRGTVMRKEFPNGFDCGDECLLNAIYTWATDHKDLFPAGVDPGIVAMKDAVEGLTGLPVNYSVLIDLDGFADLVNAVGGITIDVKQKVLITGSSGEVTGVIPAGRRELDGYHALWYARSRAEGSDYDRMARQRCVMSAMLHQLDPGNVLLKFQKIARAGGQVVSTDIPASELGRFVDLAMKAKRQTITSVQFVPPMIDPVRPDVPLIKAKVRQAIDASKRPSRPPPSKTGKTGKAGKASAAGTEDEAAAPGSAARALPNAVPGSAPKPASKPTGASGPKKPKGVSDLDSVCAAA